MSSYLAGADKPPPPDPDVPCCMAAAISGGETCTCWQPIHDQPQTDPDPTAAPGVMPAMCHDCAYRPGSPERQGNPSALADADLLDRIVDTGAPFWCHTGLRRQTGWAHPCGAQLQVPQTGVDAYDPPARDGTPYKADGTPGDHCAGWSARRRHHLAREALAEAGGPT